MRTVTINAVLNGWTVQCGCQTLVYTSRDQLLSDLREYMHDPKGKEKEVIGSAVNKRLLQDLPPGPAPEPATPPLNTSAQPPQVQRMLSRAGMPAPTIPQDPFPQDP